MLETTERTRELNGAMASRVAGMALRHGDAIGSIASAFAIQGFLVISGVIAARALGVENRGHLALLTVTPLVLAQVATLGLPLAVTYFVAQGDVDPGRIVKSLGRLIAGLTLFMMVAHWAILLVALRGQDDSVVLAGAATAIVAPGIVCQLFGLAILQGQQRFREFNVLRTLQLFAHGVMLTCLFIAGAASLSVVAISWAISMLLTGSLILALALRGGRLAAGVTRGDLPPQGTMVRFGLKSLGGYVTPVETFRIDQLIAGLYLGPAALGLYVVGLSFTNLPRLIGQSVGMVAYPRVAANAGRPSVRRTVFKFVAAVTAVNALLVAALALSIGWLVPFFFGQEFAEAVPIVRVLLLYSLVLSVRRVLIDSVRGLDRAGLGTMAEVASWPVLALSLAVLVPAYGAVGIAWALVASTATSLMLLASIASRAIHQFQEKLATATVLSSP